MVGVPSLVHDKDLAKMENLCSYFGKKRDHIPVTLSQYLVIVTLFYYLLLLLISHCVSFINRLYQRYACIGQDTAHVGLGTMHGFWTQPGGLQASPLDTGEALRVALPPNVAPAHDRETHGAQAQLPPD